MFDRLNRLLSRGVGATLGNTDAIKDKNNSFSKDSLVTDKEIKDHNEWLTSEGKSGKKLVLKNRSLKNVKVALRLSGVDIIGCTFDNVYFDGLILSDCKFENNVMNKVVLHQSVLESVEIVNLKASSVSIDLVTSNCTIQGSKVLNSVIDELLVYKSSVDDLLLDEVYYSSAIMVIDSTINNSRICKFLSYLDSIAFITDSKIYDTTIDSSNLLSECIYYDDVHLEKLKITSSIQDLSLLPKVDSYDSDGGSVVLNCQSLTSYEDEDTYKDILDSLEALIEVIEGDDL